MSALCSEPVGVRYDSVDGKIQQNEDGFYGVNPQFVYSKNSPSKLTVIWPDSKTLGENAKQWTHEAVIIDTNDTTISAIAIYNQRVNFYTLFPEKGIAFMSMHKNIPLQGGIPAGALYKLKCKYEFN